MCQILKGVRDDIAEDNHKHKRNNLIGCNICIDNDTRF